MAEQVRAHQGAVPVEGHRSVEPAGGGELRGLAPAPGTPLEDVGAAEGRAAHQQAVPVEGQVHTEVLAPGAVAGVQLLLLRPGARGSPEDVDRAGGGHGLPRRTDHQALTFEGERPAELVVQDRAVRAQDLGDAPLRQPALVDRDGARRAVEELTHGGRAAGHGHGGAEETAASEGLQLGPDAPAALEHVGRATEGGGGGAHPQHVAVEGQGRAEVAEERRNGGREALGGDPAASGRVEEVDRTEVTAGARVQGRADHGLDALQVEGGAEAESGSRGGQLGGLALGQGGRGAEAGQEEGADCAPAGAREGGHRVAPGHSGRGGRACSGGGGSADPRLIIPGIGRGGLTHTAAGLPGPRSLSGRR